MSPEDLPTTRQTPAACNGQLLRAGIEHEIGQIPAAQGFGGGLDPDGGVPSTFRNMPGRRILTGATNEDPPPPPGLSGVVRHEPDSLCDDAPTARVGMRPISDLRSLRVSIETIQTDRTQAPIVLRISHAPGDA